MSGTLKAQDVYFCQVCAFPYIEPIEDYQICHCCGFQKSVDDDPVMGGPVHKASQRWILGGMRWWSNSIPPPPGWDPETNQLPWLIEAYSSDWQE